MASKSYSTARRRANSDPLAQALQPDANETPEEAQRRKQAEAEAKKISDMIDDQIKQESKARSNRKEIKLLLLGALDFCEIRHEFLNLFQASPSRGRVRYLFMLYS